jgi:hypothetical protein
MFMYCLNLDMYGYTMFEVDNFKNNTCSSFLSKMLLGVSHDNVALFNP